jgi:hypothetical protein
VDAQADQLELQLEITAAAQRLSDRQSFVSDLRMRNVGGRRWHEGSSSPEGFLLRPTPSTVTEKRPRTLNDCWGRFSKHKFRRTESKLEDID